MQTPEAQQHHELPDDNEERLGPPPGVKLRDRREESSWREVLTFVVVLFYMAALGFLGATLLKRAFRGTPKSDDIIALDASAARFGMTSKQTANQNNKPRAVITSPYAHVEHGMKLTAMYLGDMGLSADQYELVELAITNPEGASSPVRLAETEGMVELTTEDGQVRRNLLLPATASNTQTAMRLSQRKPNGELAPGQSRQFWLLFAKPVDFKKMKSGKLSFASGETLELEVEAR